jgi:hypothetical protein
MVWDPNEPRLIADRVMLESGYLRHDGAQLYNLYRAPERPIGDPKKADKWRSLVKLLYPDEAEHIENYLAFKIQNPGVKINHALVLGGSQGIGKDTILIPVKEAIGPWNWQEISPEQMLGRFNGWQKGVMLRINEFRDMRDNRRTDFYEQSKVLMAAPPDVLRVDEKNLREHYVFNVCGVIITTNYRTDGLYLPADDRRHFVAWSDITKEHFDTNSWKNFHSWYQAGGNGDVIAYLLSKDLTQFDPKAPPFKTAAFWSIVQANESPDTGELHDLLEKIGMPQAFTKTQLALAASNALQFDLAQELTDKKARRIASGRLERVGYVSVQNPDAKDGLFAVNGKRETVYAQKGLTLASQISKAREL